MNGLDSWKVVLYLIPVALAMLWIRRREAAQGVTPFRSLSGAQKAWILLVALPPGASALLTGLLTPEQVQGYAREGSSIRGSGQNLVPGVVREFVRLLPEDWTRGVGRDLDELLTLLTRRALSPADAAEMGRLLVASWPPPAPPAPPAPEEPTAEEPPLEEPPVLEPGEPTAEEPPALEPPAEEPPAHVHP